jgi:class 3 adenylate cyclase
LYGDPTKPGVFVERVKFAPGTKRLPHWHPEERTVTVLFADIRSFSDYSRRHSAQQVVALLNRYFTAAAAVLLHGSTCRTTPVSGSARAPYCMMGVCFDCLMEIDGTPNRQACLTPVAEGMRINRQLGKVENIGEI